ATAADDSSLTWKGITFYGIVDAALQYDTHSGPFSDYYVRGSGSLVQKNDYDSPTGLVPSGLSQSRLGISGNEPIGGDWAGVFRLETPVNPQSGNLTDNLKSLTLNNGKAVGAQVTAGDGSYAGQLFANQANIGLSSPTYGTFTFGRHITMLAEAMGKYDPTGGAPQFSLIGYSGTYGGGGDTEDTRLDQSVKYTAKYGALHLGALYQFSGSTGAVDTAFQFQLGFDYAGFSADAYYYKKYDAISASALSAAQVTELQTGTCTAAAPATPQCYSIGNSLSATISDNQTFALMALYGFAAAPLKLYAGYEHIEFNNPNNPLPAGSLTIGGYVLAFTNNAAYDNQKVLDVVWGGLKWGVTPDLDLMLAYYYVDQNSYATGADAGCNSTVSGGCSGSENVASVLLDYRASKRFDLYAGSMWSEVQNGLANGYLNKSNVAATAGVRFKF
ncbi:MAG TPA: porin, partial [Steroidobacteraceae bacterium]|nr:porin [Steroidobacteraceae bacterium]